MSNMGEQQEDENTKTEESLKAWAEHPKQRSEELRKLAVEKRFDPKQVVLGYAFDVIAYDDGNIFSRFFPDRFISEIGNFAKDDYRVRVEWETSLDEVPEEIKNQLGEVRKQLEGYNWELPQDFRAAGEVWQEKVRKWMESYFSAHPEIKEAVAAYTQLETRVRTEK